MSGIAQSQDHRLHHIPVSGITIPAEVNGTALTDEQRKRIANGESVLVENMWSEKKQRHYDARLQFNACKGGFDYDFKGIAHRQEQTAAQEQNQCRNGCIIYDRRYIQRAV